MVDNVIPLKVVVKNTDAQLVQRAHFACGSCESVQFKLLEGGEIRCAAKSCGRRIKNLRTESNK